jgi:cytochrome c oxidase cbb3-type subunit 3
MPTKIEKDAYSGRDTTGHEWDGIKELNTPLPSWWVWVFIATIVWAVGLFLLYPSLPYGPGYFAGLLGYSSRVDAMAEYKAMQARHAEAMQKIAALSFKQITDDPDLYEVALTAGRIAFANNCQPCHGSNGEGRVGYPALGDDVWLWGGTHEDILKTVTHGVRSPDPDARNSVMPSFGADGILKPDEMLQVADYVMTLFGKQSADPASVAAGKQLFADNCALCHGEKGEGNREQGAPPLASEIHLYGADRATVIAQIAKPHLGMMPNWNTRLDPGTLKSLPVYVHSLGGGE